MFGGGIGSDMFSGTNGKALEASFKEFINRPENRPLVEKHQHREVKQAIQLQDKVAALKFRDAVLESDFESQLSIAPFLRNRVLRRIVQTFANDPNGDFSKWATNPRVIEMLTHAQKLMDEGRLREDDAEEFMLRMLKDPSHEHHAEFISKTKQVARLPTEQLVEALNEHLTERRHGNTAYRSGNYKDALYHYERAKSIVELVRGLSRADQAEININKVAVLCNIAAVYLATKEYGAAIETCNKALEVDAKCVKAFIRRCKAYIGRHEYHHAQQDIAALRDTCQKYADNNNDNNYYGNNKDDEDDEIAPAIAELEKSIQRSKLADRRADARTFKHIFS